MLGIFAIRRGYSREADWSINIPSSIRRNNDPGRSRDRRARRKRSIGPIYSVKLNVGRQKVKDSRAYNASTTVDRAYEKYFHCHCGNVRSNDQR